MELTQENIDKTIKEKFINKLNRNCKKSLKNLEKSNIKHRETLGLLLQSSNTIKNADMNLKKYNFVDANSLLRAALEYMIMAIMIEFDDEVFNEFVVLSNNDIQLTRKYTIINTLLHKFAKHLKKISPTLFYDTTNKEREKLITDLYDLLCKYTHASIVVSIFKEIKNDKEKEVLRLFMDYNLYFIKLMLLDCMRYLNKDKRNYIDEETIGFCIFLNIIKILNIIQNDKMNFEKFINLLYYDSVNNEFYKYIIEGIEKIKEENNEDIIKITNNIDIVCKVLNDFLVN
jgi:hypothetical protein